MSLLLTGREQGEVVIGIGVHNLSAEEAGQHHWTEETLPTRKTILEVGPPDFSRELQRCDLFDDLAFANLFLFLVPLGLERLLVDLDNRLIDRFTFHRQAACFAVNRGHRAKLTGRIGSGSALTLASLNTEILREVHLVASAQHRVVVAERLLLAILDQQDLVRTLDVLQLVGDQ